MAYQLSIQDTFFWHDLPAREQGTIFGYWDGLRSVLPNYIHMWS